ncbi:MAG TPA: hypothetical protein VHE79_14220 [Spirochaetia bacterium]
MTKKTILIVLVLGLALTGVTFANGQKEGTAPGQGPTTDQQLPGGPGFGPGYGHMIVTNGPKLTLAGTVTVHNLIHPVLKSGDKSYELLVPRVLVYEAGVKDGAKVSVEGYQVVSPVPGADDGVSATYVYVTKATVDGKDYDLTQIRGPMMGKFRGGFHGGMMGGGYGYGFGPRGMMRDYDDF